MDGMLVHLRCLAQEHNTMLPAIAWAPTARNRKEIRKSNNRLFTQTAYKVQNVAYKFSNVASTFALIAGLIRQSGRSASGALNSALFTPIVNLLKSIALDVEHRDAKDFAFGGKACPVFQASEELHAELSCKIPWTQTKTPSGSSCWSRNEFKWFCFFGAKMLFDSCQLAFTIIVLQFDWGDKMQPRARIDDQKTSSGSQVQGNARFNQWRLWKIQRINCLHSRKQFYLWQWCSESKREKRHLGGHKYCNGLKGVEERLFWASLPRNTRSCFPEHESSGLGTVVFQTAHKAGWFSVAEAAQFDPIATWKDRSKSTFGQMMSDIKSFRSLFLFIVLSFVYMLLLFIYCNLLQYNGYVFQN